MDIMRHLPPGSQVLEPTEAVRRIQERDHNIPSGQPGSFMTDEVIIALIRKGAVITALTADRQLAFWPVDLASGEPFDPDNPEHIARL